MHKIVEELLDRYTDYQNMDDETLSEAVVSIYESIDSLPPDMRHQTLYEYWNHLKKICSGEKPCMECLREHRAMERERLHDPEQDFAATAFSPVNLSFGYNLDLHTALTKFP